MPRVLYLLYLSAVLGAMARAFDPSYLPTGGFVAARKAVCTGRTRSPLHAETGTLDQTASLEENLDLLKRAAETKQEESDAVFDALTSLEKQMREKAREDPSVADSVLENLNGDWRLVFTTGTKDTQKRTGRINYFPLKAVQSFRTEGMEIENGIYLGDFAAIQFGGNFEFNKKSRKLEFDFDRVKVLGLLDIQLGQGKAAELGASSGLGSKNNVNNKRKPFFNWISADESIATARGGGGGLALWKRVE